MFTRLREARKKLLQNEEIDGALEQIRDIAQIQSRIDAITEEQNRLLELLLENLDDPELSQRMQSLTEEKKALSDALDDQRASREQSAANALRMYDIREWANSHAAGFRAYDDQFTRKLIKRISVIDQQESASY